MQHYLSIHLKLVFPAQTKMVILLNCFGSTVSQKVKNLTMNHPNLSLDSSFSNSIFKASVKKTSFLNPGSPLDSIGGSGRGGRAGSKSWRRHIPALSHSGCHRPASDNKQCEWTQRWSLLTIFKNKRGVCVCLVFSLLFVCLFVCFFSCSFLAIVLPTLNDSGKSYYEDLVTLNREQSRKQRNVIQSPNTRVISQNK